MARGRNSSMNPLFGPRTVSKTGYVETAEEKAEFQKRLAKSKHIKAGGHILDDYDDEYGDVEAWYNAKGQFHRIGGPAMDYQNGNYEYMETAFIIEKMVLQFFTKLFSKQNQTFGCFLFVAKEWTNKNTGPKSTHSLLAKTQNIG